MYRTLTANPEYSNLAESIVVREFKETVWSLGARIKEMSVSDFIKYLAESTLQSLDTVALFAIYSITSLIQKSGVNKELIAAETEVDVSYIEKIQKISEEIEDEMLTAEVEKRVSVYGNWDNALKNSIPAEEVYKKLGITLEMINNAPDIDYEVSAI